MERKTILAVDIGGTKYSVGLVSENGVIISKQKYTWWHISEESIIAEICTAMQNILDENPRIVVTAVGITITGLTDPVTGSWVSVYGDNVFEKCGKGRDEAGDREKTRNFNGKTPLFRRERLCNYQQS